MASETTTTNIGLIVPAVNQANWNVPINYDLNLLDRIFGGEVTVPALAVTELTVATLTIAATLISSHMIGEELTGTSPGSVFTSTHTPAAVLGVFKNGVRLTSSEYTLSGSTFTLGVATETGGTASAIYIY